MTDESMEWLKREVGTSDIRQIVRCHSAEYNKVYRVMTDKGHYFLKHGPKLEGERDRLVWLQGKLAVPKAIAWRKCVDNQEELITVAIDGDDLSRIANTIPKENVVRWLADILRTIHSIDISDCPFGHMQVGYIFTHGDACLPNFIFKDNQYRGAIDLGSAGVADRDVDLAATVWSLALNCGQGYGLEFLHAYGLTSATADDELRLIKKYEPAWSGY